MQGMNELLAPLYYVFKNDPSEEYAVGYVSWISLACYDKVLVYSLELDASSFG